MVHFHISPMRLRIIGFFVTTVVKTELCSTIKEIENKSSSGTNVLTLSNPLINKLFQTGTFPTSLKTAIIILLHKRGIKDQAYSYRPITLLPTLSKIFEWFVKKATLIFIEIYNCNHPPIWNFLLTKAQVTLCFPFLIKPDRQHCTALIFCDFDCANHNVLNNK